MKQRELRYKVEGLRAIDEEWVLISRNQFLDNAMKIAETEDSYGIVVRVTDTLTGKEKFNSLYNEFKKFKRQLRIAIVV